MFSLLKMELGKPMCYCRHNLIDTQNPVCNRIWILHSVLTLCCLLISNKKFKLSMFVFLFLCCRRLGMHFARSFVMRSQVLVVSFVASIMAPL
jgi:hypothetical protein